MEDKDFLMLDMFSLVYEDMDIDAIEERFVDLVAEIFSFDRVGLFFVKHRKGMLQGKLCKGFEPGTISSLEIPVAEKYLFTRPLVTGFPLWGEEAEADPFAQKMGLKNFAIIPIVSKKRISCWQVKNCQATDCPAYGNKLLHCWLVPDTKCFNGTEIASQDKSTMCLTCPVFSSQDANSIEGILLIDNYESKKPIDEKTITILSVIAHAVGIAINNSKTYSSVLRDSIHDELTGLHNRRYFNERLIDEVDRAKRYENTLSLLLCDIDHFKNVNDTYGHPVGDDVLIWLGNVFQNKLRKTDLVARFGGEEFAVVLLNTEKNKAFEIAENLRSAIADSYLPEYQKVKVTISIGISTLGVDSNSFDGLINQADKALYHAKSKGRNMVCTV
jgi:diguanylate cyclase (GGDEF)-like protein